VVIEARRAADLVGATTMDRPEDVESNPLTGRVYVVMTNNNQRKPEQIDAANPRADNRWGQIIELVPPDVNGRPDHTATENAWEFFLIAGDPADAKHSARYLGPVSSNGWLACPDNVAFDRQGRIWISTDGQRAAAGFADSVYAADTAGPGRGITRLFLNGPRGAEMTGPCFTPDSKTFFVSVQHPGDERGSTYDKPSTRWPDFQDGMPPRPAVLAVTKADGGEIGS
jgi:secreted PhoX family phosphatase